MNLEFDLVEQARRALGTRTTTETVHRALREAVRRKHLQDLAEERFEDLTPEALARLRAWRDSP